MNLRKLEGESPLRWGSDAVEIPGARKLLGKLEEVAGKWAIVTSGTRPLVDGRLDILGLVAPQTLVTAEEVQNGKPDPGCYRLGLKRLSIPEKDELFLPPLCIEDAPAGVRAGRAAGCKVLAVATTHNVEQLIDAGAHWVVQDLRSVSLGGNGSDKSKINVEIRNAFSA
ncbi:hypothetical protein LTR84_000077 [Exophiala bonariae]|uniref:Uncharacterized protein n=1 Tax=Exophiala bonariae TaxID=1690606 RepID=A0AAV9NPJ0_9EURO|nr:hypothetical protein LTR84_000077 [Exophiala bonariae]